MASASYYGANYTVVDNSPAVASLVSATEWGGVVKAVTDTFTATAGDTGSGASEIFIGKLPKNSIPLSVSITTPAAITWTGTVGYSGDPDALGDFAAFAAAGTQVTGPSAAVQNTPTSAAKDVYITTATASLVSADSIATSITYIQGG